MLIAEFYDFTEEGMNFDGIVQTIHHWVDEMHERDMASDFMMEDNYMIMLHPRMAAEIHMGSIQMSMSSMPIEASSNKFVPLSTTGFHLMDFKIYGSTLLKENEMLIINNPMLELIEKFVDRAAQTGYRKGGREAYEHLSRTGVL